MAFEMPRANKPEDVGLSSQRLQRIRDTLQADIDKGLVPGAVLLIARRGHFANSEALGYRDREDGAVMCWGLNASGQLGDGSTVTREMPMPVVF